MTHVLLCSQNLPVPADPRVWKEARTLAAAGYRVTVACPRGAGMGRKEVLEGVTILRYPSPPELRGAVGLAVETANALWWTALIAVWLRLRGRVDVIHAANPPDTFFLVALLLRPFGARFVFDQHDACPELLEARAGRRPFQGGLLRLLERLSYRTADLVIAPNNSYRRLAVDRGGCDPESVVVVRSGPDRLPDPVDARDREDGSAAPSGPPVVAFAGVMGDHDGVEVLVDAAAKVLERREGGLALDLIGTGVAVPALRERATRLGISASVRFPGWLTGSCFRSRLAGATIAVSPDGDNPFNRLSTMTKVSDYLGLGLPAVVADLPENRVTAGDAVVYFRPGDAADLAAVLDRLLDDAATRDGLRAQARARGAALLWEHSAKRLVAAYEWLLAGGPPVDGDQHVVEADQERSSWT